RGVAARGVRAAGGPHGGTPAEGGPTRIAADISVGLGGYRQGTGLIDPGAVGDVGQLVAVVVIDGDLDSDPQERTAGALEDLDRGLLIEGGVDRERARGGGNCVTAEEGLSVAVNIQDRDAGALRAEAHDS